MLPVGSILITSRATIGDCAIALAECSTNQGIQSLVVNKNYNNIFIYYWIYSNKNLFIKKSSGSTFSEINKSAIKSIKITIPTLPEQQKIAACLSALDEQIEAQEQKIELLQQHKKGLLQNLFPTVS